MANARIQHLNSNWKFRQNNKTEWHPATVPGTVHTDLMACGMIPDPFIGENERLVQWVDKEDWTYETIFDVDPEVYDCNNIELAFEGLDTYADVYLNDSLILKADNMFRSWNIPVKEILKPYGNRLRILFHSPLKIDIPKYDALGLRYPYPASNDQSENGGVFNKKVSVFARKAGYHYGWDWGPRLVTSGIWRPVTLKGWSGMEIADAAITTLSVSGKKARMRASIEIAADTTLTGCIITIADKGRKLAQVRTGLKDGVNSIEIPFDVKEPRLWWCNGMGKPELYDFSISVSAGGVATAGKTVITGIRTLELVREPDSHGRSFFFRLNGLPVFAKGANYIPCDNFLPRVTDSVYRRTIEDAANANMNMLRVWGGGVYEDDRFYNLCDSLGIMVWQDFMFACSMYPSEGALLDNIREEARQNVRRLRNHPSLAVWCGNNECIDAWYGWGWSRRAAKEGVADMMWRQADSLYFHVLPEIVGKYAPLTPYTPSSPFSRKDGTAQPNMGDFHLWTVWGGGKPINEYETSRSRFLSEYGFQSFPEIETVSRYAPDPSEHFIDSDVMLAHQRAWGGNRKIEKYLSESYPAPDGFASFLYMTQILQADAIRTAIEAHRRDKPYCMGSLFWQHNDCWPVASWSSRDYFGRWKAQHYMARKAFRDILLSFAPDSSGTYRLHAVSDRRQHVAGRLTIALKSIDGKVIGSTVEEISLAPDSVTVFEIPRSWTDGTADSRTSFLHATFECGDGSNETTRFMLPMKDILLPEADIKCYVTGQPGNYTVEVSADRFVRAFRITLGDTDYFLDDNYIDLIPGQIYRIGLRTALPIGEVKSRLRHTDLRRASKPSQSAI